MENSLTVIQAIAKFEGFEATPDNIPTRCKNPGDLCAGQFANAHGAIPGAPDPHILDGMACRYAVFPTSDVGWAALRALLLSHYVGMTLKAAMERYAPSTENDTGKYIAFMCASTGLQPDTVLTDAMIG